VAQKEVQRKEDTISEDEKDEPVPFKPLPQTPVKPTKAAQVKTEDEVTVSATKTETISTPLLFSKLLTKINKDIPANPKIDTPSAAKPLPQTPVKPSTPSNSGVECPRITGGTVWVGEITLDGKALPLSFQVGIRRGKAVNGTMTWASLEESKTKVQGSILLYCVLLFTSRRHKWKQF
jgi:hypothetical protein